MKLDDLIYRDEYKSRSYVGNINIMKISTSAEEIDRETLFVVIKSIKFDVRQIINYVLNLKPAAILCDRDIEISSEDVPILTCENTRTILPYLYSRIYRIDYKKTRFIGITGTNGKTTSATMLEHILKALGKKTGFIGTGRICINGRKINGISYSMTTPDPKYLYSVIREMQNEECEYIVMEVSSHALFFDKVLPIRFDVAAFTNLSDEHLDFHKNTEDYYNAKLKLFSRCDIGIFNLDDEYAKRAYNTSDCKKIGFAIHSPADVYASDIVERGLLGTEYTFIDGKQKTRVALHIGGVYNVYNSLVALSAAESLGIETTVAAKALNSLEYIDGRLEIIRDRITVIIDYAHTEKAYENLLKFLNSTKISRQKLITVFGCGGDRDKTKRAKIASVCERFSDYVIVTTDNSRSESSLDIIRDILQGFSATDKRCVITSREAAIRKAILSANDGDIVAIVGKGHERYSIDRHGVVAFDERSIIKKALAQRGQDNEDSSGYSPHT